MAARTIQERAFELGARVETVVERFPRTVAAQAIGEQLVRSGRAVSANMRAADGAASPTDFARQTGLALQEAQEVHYWLRLVTVTLLPADAEVTDLVQEARAILLALGTLKTQAPQDG